VIVQLVERFVEEGFPVEEAFRMTLKKLEKKSERSDRCCQKLITCLIRC